MIGRLRLISGLVLTAFVVGHFINHALGIISLKAMNDALKYFIQPWRDPVGEALLIAALLVHVVLAVHALYQRRTLAMGWANAAQMTSGFLIPVLLGAHVLATRGVHEVFGVVEGYQFTLYGMWVPSIFYGVLNVVALPVVWFHTCLGWHYWLKYKAWYQRFIPFAFAFAIALPALALAGFASASFRVARLSNSENWVNGLFKRVQEQLPEILDYIAIGEVVIWLSVPLTLVLILAARGLRSRLQERRSGSAIRYRDMSLSEENEVQLVPGTSLLELIRAADISHPSVCGGRGRCSTCRVRVDDGHDHAPPAEAAEQKVLDRINASPDVRLACQLVPAGPVSVTALMDNRSAGKVHSGDWNAKGGEEQDIAVLFADIRGFTKLSETKLPYDTAFILNRYFASMGQVIEQSGGHLDKFIGDGVMALFGVDETPQLGARKALMAAREMSVQLENLNRSLRSDLAEPLRIGIGIHLGPAIVGNMGYGKATGLTAIGDTVNIASRLESMTKEFSAQLIVSAATLDRAGLEIADANTQEVSVRGRDEKLAVHIFGSGQNLPAVLALEEMTGA